MVRWTPAEHLLSSGDTGVSLFFVLSGFILAYNYRTVTNLDQFWASRFARIYPVYFVALLLGLAYSFAPAVQATDHRALRLGLTITLLQSWYQPFAESFNGPGWTLSVEAFFYAVFPFVLRGVSQITGRAFASICGAYVACLFVLPLASLSMGGAHLAAEIAAFLVASRLPVLHLPLFLIGAYLGTEYASHHGTGGKTTQTPKARLKVMLYLSALGSLALLCAGPSGVYEPARRGLLALCYAAGIYALAQVRRGFLAKRWMVLAGEISFSIYILQMPVFRTVLGLARRLGLGPYASIGTALATLIFVSYFAYRFIEVPARVSIRKLLTRQSVHVEKI